MKKTNKGFTLVELIVVIAIIGILAAVLIPSITGYIDKARMSNDTTYATSLNRILSYYELQGGDLTGATASDIRLILKNESGDDINFTPSSKNAGFFYNADTKKIEVIKFTESGISAAEFINSPEELFRKDLYLLTKQGNIAAEVVFGLRNLGTASDMQSSFNVLQEKVNEMKDSALKTKLQGLLNYFEPSKVLYVTNREWRMLNAPTTEDPQGVSFNYVMFSEGVTNIPTNNLKIFITSVAPVIVPISVKTIETNSFNEKFLDNIELVINHKSFIAEIGAFSKDHKTIYSIKEKELPTVDIEVQYRHGASDSWETVTKNIIPTIYVSSDQDKMNQTTELKAIISDKLKPILTEFQFSRKIEKEGTFYVLKLYSADGLIGVKKFQVNIVDLDDIEE